MSDVRRLLNMVPAPLLMIHPKELTKRKLIFVSGKGGVGKTTVSQALARELAHSGHRTLWVGFEDPLKTAGECIQVEPGLWHLNCDAQTAFEEYATMKIGMGGLAKLFLRNTLMQYLSKAAPGIHEVVLMGKVWFETRNYDHVIVDMPSTGYGLAMFNSTQNYARLFKGGPIQKDAEKMLTSFRDPHFSGSLIVALPEEMPIAESLELAEHLLALFPENPPALVVNKLFPKVVSDLPKNPDDWNSPVPTSLQDYASRKPIVEAFNLKTLKERVPSSDTVIAAIELQAPAENLGAISPLEAELSRTLKEWIGK